MPGHVAADHQLLKLPREQFFNGPYPVIIHWLSGYGEEVYDGHGGAVRFFSGRSRRHLVESSGDGTVITVSKLYRNSPTIRPR